MRYYTYFFDRLRTTNSEADNHYALFKDLELVFTSQDAEVIAHTYEVWGESDFTEHCEDYCSKNFDNRYKLVNRHIIAAAFKDVMYSMGYNNDFFT
jgi:asparagine synthetase B (glutamine-hydrolysing)